MTWTVAAFYRFTPLDDLPALVDAVRTVCIVHEICGSILLAPEGINGTIAGPTAENVAALIDFLDERLGLRQGEIKYSYATLKPFKRLKVRLKKEIITLRAPEADPSKQCGVYVEAAEWNTLMQDPEVLLLDTRNKYETEMGIFKGAVDPDIEHFTHFKDFTAQKLDPAKHKKIAMYCTGGIRCEKASSYLLAHGFDKVYHLKGGILKYLETIPTDQSLWEGECFVFDEREALGHELRETENPPRKMAKAAQ